MTIIHILVREEGSYSDHCESILCASTDPEKLVEPAKQSLVTELKSSLSFVSRKTKVQELLSAVENGTFSSIEEINKLLADAEGMYNLPWYTVAETELIDL